MGTLILAVTSLLLYSVGTALQALSFRGRVHTSIAITTLIGLLALTAHGLLIAQTVHREGCLLYTSPSPRDGLLSRMPSSA